MSKWYVAPLVVRVHLSDGEWLDLKDELTVGEGHAILAASQKFVKIDGLVSRVLDPNAFYFERAAAYIVRWSASEKKDKKIVPIPFTRAALAALPVALFNEIAGAVAAHADARVKTPEPGSEEEKNAQSGEDGSKSSSDSAAS